jgi:hypothetical protein
MSAQIKIILFFISFIYANILIAQTPGFNYQALILNSSKILIPGTDVQLGEVPLSLEEIKLRFTITNEFEIEYTEEHAITTDENGMVAVIVGEGIPITNFFKDISWDGKPKFLNVELNIPSDNTRFSFLDTQKILYIPQPSNINSINSFAEQEQVVIIATDGQLQFTTPLPITNENNIKVFRNGAFVAFKAINANTIEIEPEAICYKNDKIRIVQLR